MRAKGTYKVYYHDGSFSVMYWDGSCWEMYGVSGSLTDEEVGFDKIELVIQH